MHKEEWTKPRLNESSFTLAVSGMTQDCEWGNNKEEEEEEEGKECEGNLEEDWLEKDGDALKEPISFSRNFTVNFRLLK